MIPRTSRHSIIAATAGGEAFDVTVRGHTIRTDRTVAAGGGNGGPTPLELMTAGLAACVASHVHRFCVQRGIDGKGIVVEVNPIWKADLGRIARFELVLHLPVSVPQHAHAELEAVARACPAHRTLVGTPESTVRAVAAGPALAQRALETASAAPRANEANPAERHAGTRERLNYGGIPERRSIA